MDITLPALIALTAAITQLMKDSGLSGNALRWTSFFLGAALAALFQARSMYPPAAAYIDLFLFALGVGAGAPGGYSLIKQWFPPK